MVRRIIILLLIAFLGVAYFTKPSDKTCKEEAVKAVWGSLTPGKYNFPEYYEQFMNLNAPNVHIDDWLILKRIKYDFGKRQETIGYGFLKQIVITR
jgi:hypothetical protein